MSTITLPIAPAATQFYAVWTEDEEPRSTGPFRSEEQALEHARRRALAAYKAHGAAKDAISAGAVTYQEWAAAHQVTLLEVMMAGGNLVGLGVVDSEDGRNFCKVTQGAGDSEWCTCGRDRCEHQAALRRECERRGWRSE